MPRSKADLTISDDYAVLHSACGRYDFYYGYEQTNEASRAPGAEVEWCFVFTRREKEECRIPASVLGYEQFDPPEVILLAGIALCLETEMLK
jgi:hypothetical protein